MKRFQFNLATVLGVRATQETRAMESYALAVRDLNDLNARRQKVRDSLDEVMQRRGKLLAQRAPSEELIQVQKSAAALREQWLAFEPELLKQQKVVNQRWQLLLAARQRREGLDRLREKQSKRHQADAQRKEQLSLDEMTLMREHLKLASNP